MKKIKIIHFYRKVQFGVEREFVHPDCEPDAKIIRQLTGQKTITPAVRELIRDLTASAVDFLESIAP
ncbi:MAG TPA: hypothetical protein VGR14_03760 [Verrucomicrobiae bacterium]|nr:hypothetical protein [Verrucomicrobiae bacterium]